MPMSRTQVPRQRRKKKIEEKPSPDAKQKLTETFQPDLSHQQQQQNSTKKIKANTLGLSKKKPKKYTRTKLPVTLSSPMIDSDIPYVSASGIFGALI